MLEALAYVLNLMLQPCYAITGNWWVAIALFTVLTKVILMPISLWCQKNALNMVQLMPDLNRIKARYYGDSEAIGEKQTELYKERHYHPLLSLVPLAIQIIILFGLVDVVHSITDSGLPGTEAVDMTPIADGGLCWLWPVVAGLSAVALCYAQNRINPLQREQSRAEQNATNGVSIGIAVVLGVLVPAGMAFYWVCSNLTSIAVQAACNVIMRPSKYVDYGQLAESREELEALEAVGGPKRSILRRDPLAKRERADYKRFFSIADKHLVFYSEGAGFWRYYESTVKHILASAAGVIHYVTNDPDDPVFEAAEKMPRLVPYYIGPKRAITLFMKMDADVVVMTMQDLDASYMKRSYVRKDIEYIFMFHHMTSVHLVSSKTAEAYYDTVLCTGPHQVAELERAQELYGFPEKNLVEAGYPLLDDEIAALSASQGAPHAAPTVLIAPSWQEDSILDTCIDEMLGALLGNGWRVIVRPHPEYVKRYAARWDALKSRFGEVPESELSFQDASSNEAVWSSSVVVTDWSSIGCEFSLATLRPSVFVDTPMKVHNPDWEELGMAPTDITLRDRMGARVQPSSAGSIDEVVREMLANAESWRGRIEGIRNEFVFNVGHGAQVSGDYILEAVLRAQERHDSEE